MHRVVIWQVLCTEMLRDSMRPSGALATVMLLVLIQLLGFKPIHAEESGTVIPAESKAVCFYRCFGEQAIHHFMSYGVY